MTTETSFADEHDRKTLIKQAEFWLKMHDVYERAAKVFVDIKAWMAHWNDRGPEDFEKNQRDLESLLASAVREGARRANVQFGSYNEGGGSWGKWIVPGLVTLAVMGVGGGILMFGKLSAIEANQINQGLQISELKAQVSELRQHMRVSP